MLYSMGIIPSPYMLDLQCFMRYLSGMAANALRLGEGGDFPH